MQGLVDGCMRFKSYTTIKNFSQATQRTVETKQLPASKATDVSSDKPKKAACERNLMAISCLIMAFQDDALLNMIEKSETSDWPSGLVYRVVNGLFKKVSTCRYYQTSRYEDSVKQGFNKV
jgi:hypothetical protein